MSVEAITWAFQQDVSTGAKFLLVALANNADKSGVTIKGRRTLADDCSCRAATVSDNMARLEKAGLIKRFERRRQNGSRTSDYTVLAPGLADRGAMIDADREEYPDVVVQVATRVRNTEGSGTENAPGQVRNPGSPDPLGEPLGEKPSPKTPSSSEPEGFATWLQFHVDECGRHGVTREVPRAGTSARAKLAQVFGTLAGEGYVPRDFELASIGVLADEFMRSGGHTKHENVLRKEKIAGRIDDGRAAVAAQRDDKWGTDG